MEKFTTRQLKAATKQLYKASGVDAANAYRLAIVELEKRLSENAFNNFLDAL